MKIRLTSPTFDASAQTVTHASFSDVGLAGIQLIVNVTDQVIIYNFADTTKGGSLTGDVLTLEFDTTSMSDTDQLMVLVEDGVAYPLPTGAATAANQASILAAVDGLEALLGTIDADTGAILTAVDGIEALLTTIDADTSALVTSNAAIQTAVESIDNAIAGNEMQVDVVAALPAGNNNIGDVDVASIAAGDNNIGNVDIVTMPGTGVEDAAETAGGTLLMAGSVRRDTAASSAGTTGDNATINTDSVGALWTRDTASQVDDAAFTPATGRVMPIAFLADETATDSVDEGDAGIPRMTLNRRLITAGQVLDDAAFGIGTEYVTAQGLLADETSSDSVDEGDIGVARMTLDRKAIATLYPSSGATDGLLVANFNTGDTYTALTNSAQVIKASAGNLYGYYIYNPNSAATYVMIYNIAAASVTVGTSTAQMVFCIPATSGANLMFPYPISFTNAGWSIAAATTGGGNSAPATALEAMIWYR